MEERFREEANIIEGDQPWLLRNIVPVAALILAAAAGAVGYASWEMRKKIQEQEARLALDEAATPAKQIEIAKKYLGTGEAAVALLEAASEQYQARDYQGAIATFSLFLEHYPKHPLYVGGLLGKGTAQLANKTIDEAITTLEVAAQAQSNSSYTPIALLQLASAYQQTNRTEDRKRVLTQLSQSYASSIYGQEAIVELAQMNTPSPPSTADESSETVVDSVTVQEEKGTTPEAANETSEESPEPVSGEDSKK